MKKTRIAVFPREQLVTRARLWEALAALYSLDFVAYSKEANGAECDAAFLFCASREDAERIGGPDIRYMAFINGALLDVSSASAVKTSNDQYLRQCFRGRSLPDQSLNRISALEAKSGDEIVARFGADILWLQDGRSGAAPVDFVAMDAPQLAATDYLFEHFQSERWVRLLPLLHFLQQVSGWTAPPLRAALMFDDPNLHWKSYGYIDYAALAAHARRHNYHASFATIPLDGWYVHPKTAALFNANRERLSLAIHGNNHTYYELTQAPDEARRLALAAQALNRIERFEAASGLQVSRVMAAPHGACNHAMADALRRTGFEAACISRSSVMIRNPGTAWPLTIGMTPAEFLGPGLAVYPRYNIRWDDSYPIFSAFLGQPVVAVGHHEDSADNLKLLQQKAELINSLGVVHWTDLQSIARTNFTTRREGEVLNLRMFSQRITLTVPEGINRVAVERSWSTATNEALALESDTRELVHSNGAGPLLAVRAGDTVSIRSIANDLIDRRSVQLSRTPMWALARRQLCEGRDRLRPTIDRFRAHKNGSVTG